MHMNLHRPLSLFAALAVAAGLATQARAQSPGQAVLAGIAARNPALQSYQARVHVDVRMLNFPWLSPKLDGTSYFKRPDSYEVVFDRVPSYAHGINKLFGDIDDVASWEKECNIGYDGVQTVDGHPLYVLQMTKKIYSDQLKEALAYVDPSTYQVVRMDWQYRNGGAITMTQTFRQQGPYNVVATQHADIHIPHVRAVADATYGDYQTNVAVSDEVFAGK
jgi:outer membrane lipoprotein-sorting protein